MADDYVIEHRAVRVPMRGVGVEPTYRLSTTYGDVVRELENFGTQVIDLERLEGMLVDLAERLKPRARREGPVCQGCGYPAEHHVMCRQPGLTLYDEDGQKVEPVNG